MPRKKAPNGDSSAFQDALEEVMFESEEAARLAKAAQEAPDAPGAIARALRTLEKAFETDSQRRREKGLLKALEIDPGCTDALTVMAQTFDEPADASLLLEAAVAVAERRLGPKLFEEQKGELWALPEARPFMRALYALAEAEIASMDLQAGIEHFNRLLDLSELDKLGVRRELLGILLTADRVEEARKVAFERYGEDEMAYMLWARALILYLERDFDAAVAMLERAKEANPHVEDMLTGDVDLPEEEPPKYAMGSPEEAALVVSGLAAAWRSRPLAVVWMKVGGKPGDDRYFGAYTDLELEEMLDEFDDELFDDEDIGEDGPILVH